MATALAYGIDDAARQMSVSRATIYRLIEKGQLRMVKLGRKTLIPADSLRALLADTAEAA